MGNFQERINYSGNLAPLLQEICTLYGDEKLIEYNVISVGYEDFNVKLSTNDTELFLKILSNERSSEDVQRYASILDAVAESSVASPKIHKLNGKVMQSISAKGQTLHFCLMEFIQGVMLYDLKFDNLTDGDINFLARQAATMHHIECNLENIYDKWDTKNFEGEYLKNKDYFTPDECTYLDAVQKVYRKIPFSQLPRSFIHGDLINTNILRSQDGKLCIIDFAVASCAPRIQDIAVLLCNVLFSENEKVYNAQYKKLLDAYQTHQPLTAEELAFLPNYITIAHGMHFMCATLEKRLNKNNSAENEYWLQQGLRGLRKDLF